MSAVIDLTHLPVSPPASPPAKKKSKKKSKKRKRKASPKKKSPKKSKKKKPLHPCCNEAGAPVCAICMESGGERGAHTMVYLRHNDGRGHCLCTACWAQTKYSWLQDAVNPNPHHPAGAVVGQGSPHGLRADGTPYPNAARPCECMRCNPAQLGRPVCPMCRQIVTQEEYVNCDPAIAGGARHAERVMGCRFTALRRERNRHLLSR